MDDAHSATLTTFHPLVLTSAHAAIPGCLNSEIVDIAATNSGNGYWLVGSDGGVFTYGDAVAPSNNPLHAPKLNQPVVEATRTSGNGLARRR